MQIVLIGLNHRTAPVSLREQLALECCGTRMALEDLGALRSTEGNGKRLPKYTAVTEVVILSTCNRLEVYAAVAGKAEEGMAAMETFLAQQQGISPQTLRPHLYFKVGKEAVVHLMRVASGLDSMILGESQILGQVAAAAVQARGQGTVGPLLSHLFDQAAHAGKRARAETGIGRHTTSIGHAAVQLISERVGRLDQAQVLIIGAGEMAELTARALQTRDIGQLTFMNRTHARAERLARKFSARARNWYHLSAALVEADAVVSATSAPHLILHTGDVKKILPDRAGRQLLFVDIAVPHDIEVSVRELPGVQRFDIDQLQSTVDENLSQRQSAIPDVLEIVAQEAARFDDWLQGRQVLPVLVEMRRKAHDIANSELARHEHRLNELDREQQQLVEHMIHRVVNRLMHDPTVRLKDSAANGNGVIYAHAIRELFALNPPPAHTAGSSFKPKLSNPPESRHDRDSHTQPTNAFDE